MITESTNNHIPQLRFPEFQNDGEWSFVHGKELFEPIVNKNHNSDLPVLAITQDQGAVPRDMIDYNVIVSDKSIAGYKVVEVGDFIISLRSFQGGIEYSHYKGLCSPAYIVLRKRNEIVCNEFYRYYFKSARFIQDLNRNLEGIRDGKMISYQQFSAIIIPFPPLAEQRRIAACLLALDEMLAATNDKLEQLKAYKKGLMQKLFPTKGKTLPEYRFKEFEKDGEWKVKKLEEIAEKITTKNKTNKKNPVLTNSAIEGIINQQDYFDREIVTKDNLMNYYLIELDDFVYNPRISNAAPVGPISRNKNGKGIMSPLYIIFRFKKGDIDFYEHYFRTSCWHQYLKNKANFGARFDRMNITNEDFLDMPLPFPLLAEQQRIASVLSEFDAMLSATKDKLEQLKAYKKGLMQGMFINNI